VLCTSLQRLGAVGLATNGGVRDIAGIRNRAAGFQLFAPGTVVSHGTATILEVAVPVSICGLNVHPGDLLHGDQSGLLNVPFETIDQLVEKSRSVHEKEGKIFEFLKSDSFSLDGLKARLRH
jgi:4-hydroxy-4-methyl-2-oxoglutarate aldolase